MASSYSCSPLPQSRPSSSGSRPTSITRSSRESFVSGLQYLPPETVDKPFELDEEVLDIEDVSENEDTVDEAIRSYQLSERTQKSDNSQKGIEDEESKMDPEVRKGIEKIRKLDKILADKTEREKEVKQQRRALEKEFQMQVESLIKEKGMEKVCGSQQLLSLCASTDSVDDSSINEDIQPIFATQIDAEFYQEKKKSDQMNAASKLNTPRSLSADKKTNEKKDFIKRNKQLASQANEIIALTEEERKRLDELLADDGDLLLIENPFTVPSIRINGYQFSTEDQENLENIDERLKDLIPEEEYRTTILNQNWSNLDSSRSIGIPSTKSEISVINDIVNAQEAQCGEKVLQEEQDERSMLRRLKDVEDKLNKLYLQENTNDTVIDPDLLRQLLDVDSRLTSSSTSICDSVRSKSELHDIGLSSIDGQSMTGLDTDRSFIQFPVS